MDQLLWNPRGNLILVQREDLLHELMRKGFIRANQEEIEKYQPGAYHPAYDQGQQEILSKKSLHVIYSKEQGNVLRVIEV